MSVRVVPVVDAPWDDVRTVFGTRGDPSSCWCQFFKVDAANWKAGDRTSFERSLCDQVDEARAAKGAGPGLLAYSDDEPAGWVAIEPRAAYRRIVTKPAVADVDPSVGADDTWVVSCFVVRVGQRRKGIASTLLAGAVEHARANGARVIEAFPVEAGAGVTSAELYHGPLSVFEAAGFEVLARPRERRAFVRLTL
ncbi:GNAT family N-acetyltransferase [Naasia lichenicola]|uniref:GNAT family N-acetyltransferase n=1 Tax=Naasia lichenicola TaxID=2565933 RepID=A0A4S4FS86_9MICO|nr:GNAT family N-acetyltransferase [Naasia lichenicola]THG33254.1 GNAT family N-acetyltransferase [Naasia lichenicola]